MHHRHDSEDDTGQGGRSPRRSSRARRLVKAVLLGGLVAVLTRTGVRARVLDALFGPEEEFEYESETDPEPLTDLATDPAGGAGDSEDHDEEPDAPAGDEPDEVAGASWERAPAQDGNPDTASPDRPDDPLPAASEPELRAAPDRAPASPFAPRIFAVPSVPTTDPPSDGADAPPATAEALQPDPPGSYIRTPPASYVPDAAASDVPATDVEPAWPGRSATPELAADGDQPDADQRYSWGGNAAVAVPAPAAGEEPLGDGSSPAGGAATTADIPPPAVTDHPLPRVERLTSFDPSPGVSAPFEGPPPPTHDAPVFSGDVEPEAPVPTREPTERPSRGPLSQSPIDPLAHGEAEADDGAPAESESWAIAPPFVIGEDLSGREPEVEPWRTAPSIVIENGDLIEGREPAAAVVTPWSSSDTNGGTTPRPWTSPEAPERRGEHRSPSSTIAPDDETPLATMDSRSAESLVHDAPPEGLDAAGSVVESAVATTEPAGAAPESSPAPPFVTADARVESPVASAASAESPGETAVPDATAVPADGAVVTAVGTESPAESAELPGATTAPAEGPVAAPAETPVATAERAELAEPAIGEAAPRRSGWWLSRRRRGPGAEPPRWD